MRTLTVTGLDDEVVERLQRRASEHGRSPEAEHRAILRAALIGNPEQAGRAQAADRLAAFRDRTGGRGAPSATELLRESRQMRLNALAGAAEPN